MIAANADTDRVCTLGDLFLRSERAHDRPFAFREWHDGKPDATPDWRLHRQILRAAIYLRERCGVGRGDRIAVVAPLGPRSVVVEWGAVLLGATAGLLAPDETEAPSMLGALSPGFVFDVSATWSQGLELGGTLDTAERAQSIRALARSIEAQAPALAHREGTNGARGWVTMSHGEAMDRIKRLWFSTTWPDEVTLSARPDTTLSARLALLACIGDGRTRVTFAAPDNPKGNRGTHEQHDRLPGA
jgi:hypothetical protein